MMTIIWRLFIELLVLFILMLASTFSYCCYAIINWIYFYSLLDAQCALHMGEKQSLETESDCGGFVVKSYQRSFCLRAATIHNSQFM